MLAEMVGFILGTKIGEWQYAIPVLCILALAFTKTLTIMVQNLNAGW